MHIESDDDHDDCDYGYELVSERWDDNDRDSSLTGWRSSLASSFQRRGETASEMSLPLQCTVHYLG